MQVKSCLAFIFLITVLLLKIIFVTNAYAQLIVEITAGNMPPDAPFRHDVYLVRNINIVIP